MSEDRRAVRPSPLELAAAPSGETSHARPDERVRPAALALAREPSPADEGARAADVEALRKELDYTRAKLARRDAQLAQVRTEMGVLRAVAGKVGDTAGRYMQASAEPRHGLRHWLDDIRLDAVRYVRRRWLLKAEADAIEEAGVFDRAWYLRRYPDVAEANFDPLLHYLRHGALEGRDPHPLFDHQWYRSTYPEATSHGLSPLGHFAIAGAAKCYEPNPLFQTAWYVAQNPDVSNKRLNPLRHYMDHAAEPGRNPNPLFDSAWYLKQNPELRSTGENPLGHYLHTGFAELRNPHPLFDCRWYLAQDEHVSAAGFDALEHYLTVGVFEGRRFQPEVTAQPAATPPGEVPPVVLPVAPAVLAAPLAALEPVPGIELVPLAPAEPEPTASPRERSISPTDIMSWKVEPNAAGRAAQAFTGEIGVFLHLYYEELAEEMAASLLAIPYRFKVYVSTNNEAKKELIEATFRRFGLMPIIKVVPNRGWDVAPFAVEFNEEMRAHEIGLKLHGKLSRHSRNGFQWRKYLLSGLVGDRRNVQDVVETFMANPKLGVLMLPHWRSVAAGAHKIGANYQHMRALLLRAGLSISSDQRIEFPSGSMFWFRGKAMEPMLDLGLTWPDFNGCRPRSMDATIAHAVERSFLIFAAMGGFGWTHHVNRTWWGAWTRPRRDTRPKVALPPPARPSTSH